MGTPFRCVRPIAIALLLTLPVLAQEGRPPAPHAEPAPTAPTASAPISMDLRDVDVRDALRALGAQSGANIVAEEGVTGRVTIRVEGVTFDQALQAVVATGGFRAEFADGIWWIRKGPAVDAPRLVVEGTPDALDVEARNVPVNDLIAELGRKTGANVVAAPGIEGTVTISLRGLGTRRVVEEVAASRGWSVVEADGVLRIVATPPAPPPPPAPVESSVEVRVEGGLLSVDVDGVSVERFVRATSEAAGVNVIVEASVPADAKVTGRLSGVPVEEGLRTLLSANNLRLRRTGGIYRVLPAGAAAAEGAAAAPTFEVTVDDSGLVTVEAEDADLGALLREVFTQAKKNVLVYGSVREKANVHLGATPLETVLTRLLEGTPYGWNLRDGVYLIGEKALGSATAGAIVREEIIDIQHGTAADIVALLPPTVPANAVKVLSERNAVAITGAGDLIEKVRRYIEAVDREPVNITIESLVVEYRDNADYRYNLSMTATGALGGKITLAPGSQTGELSTTTLNTATLGEFSRPSFDMALRWLITEGRASIKTGPSVTVVSGKEATVRVASEEFFRVTTASGNSAVPLTQIEKIPSGITFKITPFMSDRGDQVTLIVLVEDSSAGERNADGLPAIATRSATTRVVMKPEETLVLGGLERESSNRGESRVPGLGRLPGLGWLFRNRTTESRRSTLAFFITPRIARPSEIPAEARPVRPENPPSTRPVPDRRAEEDARRRSEEGVGATGE